jgi:hypothetical protein
MLAGLGTGKDLKGVSNVLLEVLSLNFLGETEEYLEECQDSR